MKLKILVILPIIILLSGCGREEYAVYVNGKGYNLNDEVNIDITLNSESNDVSVCPTIKIEHNKIKDALELQRAINYTTENIEIFNLNLKELSETHGDNYFTVRTDLESTTDTDLSSFNKIASIKIKLGKEGTYNISLDNSNLECYTKYKDNLKLEITK